MPESFISEIAKSRPVAYAAMIKRLRRKDLRTRINELRDYYGTFMVRHGLIREEVDLLQGRIPPNIFIRHYWSPSFKELRERTLKAVADLQNTLISLFSNYQIHKHSRDFIERKLHKKEGKVGL